MILASDFLLRDDITAMVDEIIEECKKRDYTDKKTVEEIMEHAKYAITTGNEELAMGMAMEITKFIGLNAEFNEETNEIKFKNGETMEFDLEDIANPES